MQRTCELIRERARALLFGGTVKAVIGWKKGCLAYDETPAMFYSCEELGAFVYDGFSAAALSKYLIGFSAETEGKILAPLKPCDTYSFNQLVREHKIDRERVYVLGIGCKGMLDVEKIRAAGMYGILAVEEKNGEVAVHTLYGDNHCARKDIMLEKCVCCKTLLHAVYDEVITTDVSGETLTAKNRFEQVKALEAMSPKERYGFWQKELSRCIRCNACRNICPACTCRTCIFDNNDSGIASKANTDSFEEKMFHIIRAFHVAGRCTDCGECSRVCPRRIPLHLFNRKYIGDINKFYGEYQAGADIDADAPLTSWRVSDADPGEGAKEAVFDAENTHRQAQ